MMMKVKALSEYTHYIDTYFKGKQARSNFSLSIAALKEKIEKGNVQLQYTENFLCVLVEKESHYDFYYHRYPDSGFDKSALPTDKPVLLCEAYVRDSEHMAEDVLYWEKQGFKFYKRAGRTVKKLQGELEKSEKSECIQFLKPEDAGLVRAYMQEWFDAIADQIPSGEELLKAAEGNQIFAIYESDKQLKGFVYFTEEKNYVTLMHIGVNPDFRRQGIGSMLLNHLTNLCVQQGKKRVYAWINDDNLASRKMHEQNGYVSDGKIVNKMIIR